MTVVPASLPLSSTVSGTVFHQERTIWEKVGDGTDSCGFFILALMEEEKTNTQTKTPTNQIAQVTCI